MNKELLDALSPITNEEQQILDGQTTIEQKMYSDTKDFIIDSKKFLSPNSMIRIRPNTRFVHFPRHKHNYIEMIYMCCGSTTHIINGKQIVLNSGEILILSQGASQEVLPAGINDIAINFIILPEFFDRALSMMESEQAVIRDFLTGCLKSGNSPIDFLYFQASESLPVQNLMENLIWSIIHKRKNAEKTEQITVGLLFTELINSPQMIDSGRNSYEQEILINVLTYVDEHYKEGSLYELSDNLNVNYTWLSKMVKKMTGQTYTELIWQKRLERACHLLINTNMSVADISVAAGYENISYFHRIFFKKYQMTPRKWRITKRQSSAFEAGSR